MDDGLCTIPTPEEREALKKLGRRVHIEAFSFGAGMALVAVWWGMLGR